LDAGAASGAWVVGPRLVDASGDEAAPKHRFPPPLAWRAGVASGDGWRAVPWIAGAAMLFTPGHTDLRFDPRIFMYGEDEELCWRVWRHGGRVVLAERARVVHEGGSAALTRWSTRAIARRMVWNRARFVRWHAGWRGLVRFAADLARRRVAATSARRASA
ncbi:MAG TPA: hypothetical protein VG709_01135, partial [Actinomycetota bacterium]|nr:hypothetical protein [Actinomycetota bacterium]